MKKLHPALIALSAVVLLGGGCLSMSTESETEVETEEEGTMEEGSEEGTEEEGEEEEEEGEMGAEVTSTTTVLAEQNNSGESGTATLTKENGTTKVVVTLTGQSEDADQPAHIHVGSCATIGAVLYPLNNVVDGKSETIINAELAEILSAAAEISLNVHMSPLDLGTYVACGDIEA